MDSVLPETDLPAPNVLVPVLVHRANLALVYHLRLLSSLSYLVLTASQLPIYLSFSLLIVP